MTHNELKQDYLDNVNILSTEIYLDDEMDVWLHICMLLNEKTANHFNIQKKHYNITIDEFNKKYLKVAERQYKLEKIIN